VETVISIIIIVPLSTQVCEALFTLHWNDVFILKRINQMFSVLTTPGKIENTTITAHFGFAFEKTLGQGNHIIFVTSSFSKSSGSKMFSIHAKTQSRRFQIPLV